MIDGRTSRPADWTPDDIRGYAPGDRVGADGLVFVEPGVSPEAIRMVYFNSDGSRAALCGNAPSAPPASPATSGSGTALSRGSKPMLVPTTSRGRCGRAAEIHLAPVGAP